MKKNHNQYKIALFPGKSFREHLDRMGVTEQDRLIEFVNRNLKIDRRQLRAGDAREANVGQQVA